MTIVEKICNLLNTNPQMSLQEIYEKMPEHTPAAIRGNLYRHLKTPSSKIKRLEKGVYSVIEVLKVENHGEYNKVNYISRYFSADKEIAYFHTNFNTSEDIKEGIYSRMDNFPSFEQMEEDRKNVRAIMLKQDAREILSHLKTESISLIITDPPYRVLSGGTGGKNAPRGMLSKNDGKIFEHNDIHFSEYISELYRVLKNGCHAYIFTNFLNLQELMNECTKVGFKIHNLLVWEKQNATPNRWYMKNCEYILFLRKGKAKSIKNAGSLTVHKYNNIIGNKEHETEKPIDLLESYILNSSEENDWILDPFGGSFSTLIASLLHNRKIISGEIDSNYFQKGMERAKYLFATGKDLYARTTNTISFA